MAQADSTPTSVRDPITGADTDRSTNQVGAASPLTLPLRDSESPGTARLVNRRRRSVDRRYFIGGSDARIIMGTDEAALLRLWREKRGEVEPKDLSGNLVVQLGVATEDLNRRPPRSMRRQVLCGSALSWPTPLANGSRRIGRYAPSMKRQPPIGWELL
jgi:hypothetical protein